MATKTKTKAPKKAHVPKKADLANLKVDEKQPTRTRRQWTANDHRELLVEWSKVAFGMPIKSMVTHVSKAFAVDDNTALKIATEFDIRMKQLVNENAEAVLTKVAKDYNGEVLTAVEDIESID